MVVTSLRKTVRDDKREVILDEASAQFNEYGFHDVRLEDIADALGAKKASISYHFQSKAALLAAAYARSCDYLDRALREAAENSDGRQQAGSWIRSVAQMHSSALTNDGPQLAILNDLDALGDGKREEIEARIALQLDHIERFLTNAAGTPPPRGAVLLLWTLPGWIEMWLSAVPARRHGHQIEALAKLLEKGIARLGEPLPLASLPLSGDGASMLFNREERARLKRDAFERAGIRRFNKQGYGGFSLNALADELGVSRGTFYYTFADKDALLEAAAKRSHARILAVLEAVGKAPGPALPNIAGGLVTLYSEHTSNLEPMLRGCIYKSLPTARGAVADAEWQGIAARLASLLAECAEQGGCSDHGVDKLELILLAALRNIAVSSGLSGFPGGNPFNSANAADYFALFTLGLMQQPTGHVPGASELPA